MQTFKCCKNCVAPKRHAGCHSTCEEYLTAREKHDKIREKMVADQQYRNIATATLIEGKIRMRYMPNTGAFKRRKPRC